MGVLERLLGPLRSGDDPSTVVRRLHGVVAADSGVPFPVRLWDGTVLGPDDAPFRLVLRHPWSLRAMLVPPTDRAAGEAYLRDHIDVEGSMVDAIHAVAALREASLGWSGRGAVLRDLLSLPAPPHANGGGLRGAVLRGRRHTRERDEQAVRFHYDVGNDFYRLLLGESLVYSCAYFVDEDAEDPADDPAALDRAQRRKLDLVCRKLRLRLGDRLLDVGCGWGSLVLHAADHYGVRALGITLSPEQAEAARERVASAGLEDRVEIRVQDYRDVGGTFDAVASVGMFEHVGEPRFEEYFRHAYDRTAPGGRFLNHAITTGRRDEVRDLSGDDGSFVGRYVFPDGTLAPAHVAARLMEQAGFELLDVHQLRRHYAITLRHWLHRLERDADRVRQLAGDTVFRIWRAYMAGSVVGFEGGDLGVVQVLGVKPGGTDELPLGRSWMMPRVVS